jgi:Mycobacterium 19 kDa lipoprotein antigen
VQLLPLTTKSLKHRQCPNPSSQWCRRFTSGRSCAFQPSREDLGHIECVYGGTNTPVGRHIVIGASQIGAGNIRAVVSDAGPPVVNSIVLGHVNGVGLGHDDGYFGPPEFAAGGNAQATVLDPGAGPTHHGNSYVIKGTATAPANTGAQVTKPFEIDVTCPADNP